MMLKVVLEPRDDREVNSTHPGGLAVRGYGRVLANL
jgi:hypothetical protein